VSPAGKRDGEDSMVGPNKILTVSYGTFSCTLEGFDDPFSTMKAIAEYFRDLAAEDRYFGAEPPTPDAEMLHKIAEREIQRRVEARIQDGGVILRPQIEVAPRPQPAPAAPPAPAAAMAPQPAAEADQISAMSERLQRIRAAVAGSTAAAAPRAPAEDLAAPPAPATSAIVEAIVAPDQAAEAARLAAEAEAQRLASEVEAERLAAEAARVEAEAEAARIAAEEEAARLAAEAEVARLRAEAEAEAARIEAEAAEAIDAMEGEVLDAPAPAPDAQDAPRQARRIVVVRSARPAMPQAAEPVAALDQPLPVAQGWAAEAFQPAPQPDVQPVAPQGARADEVEAPLTETAPATDATPPSAAASAAASAPAPTPAATAAALADFGDEDDEDDAEEERRWAEAAARIAAAQAQAAARAAAAAETAAQNSATGAALAEEPAEPARADAQSLAALVESQRQAILREVSGEQSVARLISQTEAQLSDADAQRRQSTISHLKAAVLATRAEQEATGTLPGAGAEAAELARYRADLEQTVRGGTEAEVEGPRRPVRVGGSRAERPTATQPPLVLVSEQRIDRPAETEVVLPRRIATDASALDELFDEAAPIRAPLGKAFTDFVAPLHLTTVAEMTEAGAAYLTHVAGHEDFTRPTVMKLVMSTDAPMTRSRENLLRAFGMLMRQGVLRRSRRGQFEIAETSAFVAKAQRFANS
jgi:hypothetical protein